ncbi:MAG: alpha hydrolase [Halobacteriaceae archaeon]
MRCGVLFSGGKDSALAALLLDEFYDVVLLTVDFGIVDTTDIISRAAEGLGFEFQIVTVDSSVAFQAIDIMVADGYPRNGIQFLHNEIIKAIPQKIDIDAIADGTRRDDRVPIISRSEAQHIEDTYDIEYIAPLKGFGRDAIDAMVETRLQIIQGQRDEIDCADYEIELRELIRQEYSDDKVQEIFPDHTQTYVQGYG